MLETLIPVLILVYFIGTPTAYLYTTISSKYSTDIQHQPLVIEAVKSNGEK